MPKRKTIGLGVILPFLIAIIGAYFGWPNIVWVTPSEQSTEICPKSFSDRFYIVVNNLGKADAIVSVNATIGHGSLLFVDDYNREVNQMLISYIAPQITQHNLPLK